MIFPEIKQGEEDARAGKWREVKGDAESMAYELGRMLTLEPPAADHGAFSLPGLVKLEQYVERIMKDVEQCPR